MLPTLNERDNIVPLLARAYAAYPALWEAIVVDDASSDGTAEVAISYAAEHQGRRIQVCVRGSDHGLTKSLWHGVMRSSGEVIVWMDCDLSMPPELIPTLVAGLADGYDIVVGSRFVPGGSFKRATSGTRDSTLAVVLSRGMNYFVQAVLDHRFKDYTSGFIAVPRAVVADLRLRGDYGEYFIDLMFRAMRAGYVVLEVPYVCVPREHGKSKTGSGLPDYLARGWKYVVGALALRLGSVLTPPPSRRAWRTAPLRNPVGPLTLRAMRLEDVPTVAGLHHRILHDTVSSRLGIPFLERLYAGLLADPMARSWVAWSDGQLLGFISVTKDLSATEAAMRAAIPFRERLLVLWDLVTSHVRLRGLAGHELMRIYARLRFGRRLRWILTLGVRDYARGTGLAGELLEAADAFLGPNADRYFVDTRHDNPIGLAFYARNGFVRQATIAGNVVMARASRSKSIE